MSAVNGRAVLGRHVGGIDDVLDANGNASQRTALGILVERACLRHDKVGIEELPCLHRRLSRSDAFQAGARDCFAGGLAGAHGGDDLARGQLIQSERYLASGDRHRHGRP
jgi:hypothetical protein